jgi:pimeloyl-ACP methyl ester carboxylesterase
MIETPRGCVVVAALLAFAARDALPQSAPSVVRESTTVRSFDGRTMPATIVRVPVPERRIGGGRTISISAIHVRSTAARPGRPIVFLMGGPGIPGSVMAPIPPYFSLFDRLRTLADVVIVDQRGIGRSDPVLDCPFGDTLPRDVFERRDRIVTTIQRQVAACATLWRSRGVDPTAFNTVESAADLEDLRTAIGAEGIDLLAFSYGSRLALAYVDRHGDRVGRVVLQGVNGPGHVLKRPGPVARKLDRLSQILARDSSWHGATDLDVRVRAARERLTSRPATVTVNDRRSGSPIDLRVGTDGFDAIVALNLDDGRLPALIVSVAAGDDRVLARFVESAWNGLGSGSVGLMARATNCAADRPAARWELVRSEARTAPFGALIDNDFLTDEFCRAVGYERPPTEFSRPLGSAVPTLLLTGSLDATNPVENAAEVARGLTNAVSIEIENAVHEALPAAAVQEVVIRWFAGDDVRAVRLSVDRPRFLTIEQALAPPPPRGR